MLPGFTGRLNETAAWMKACYGAQRAMARIRVPLSSITLGDAERAAVRDAMMAGALSSAAPAVSAFEAAMAEATGRAFASGGPFRHLGA